MDKKIGQQKAEVQVQHVFLVGAKSLGAYGGYETFVYKLTEHHQNNEKIKYHVIMKKSNIMSHVRQTVTAAWMRQSSMV